LEEERGGGRQRCCHGRRNASFLFGFSSPFSSNRGEAERRAGCKLDLSLQLQWHTATAPKTSLFPLIKINTKVNSPKWHSSLRFYIFGILWWLRARCQRRPSSSLHSPPSPVWQGRGGQLEASPCSAENSWKGKNSWKGTKGTFSSSPSPSSSQPEGFAPPCRALVKEGGDVILHSNAMGGIK